MPFLDLIRAEPSTTSPYEQTNKPPSPTAPALDAVCSPAQEAEDATADESTRQVRAAFAPIRHQPPADCIGRIACSRLGPCERRVAGRPCENPAAVPNAETY